MNILTDQVDHVIGVDPDRDRITAAIVAVGTGGELQRQEFPATRAGYRAAIGWANAHTESASRVWSIEGAGSYGAGLAMTLQAEGEQVVEFDRPATKATRDGAKTDGLDAVRAARELLGRTKWAQPRARGEREAMRVLLVARNSAQVSRVAAINESKALVVTAPVDLRETFRGLNTPKLVERCAHLRPNGDEEHSATKLALRLLARRVEQHRNELEVIDAELAG